jgi:hypothetical protein
MITCTKCNNSFEPTQEQSLMIQQISSNGGSLAMLNCRVCGKMFPYNITNITDEKEINDEIPFLCPISHCGGLVSFIDDEEPSFYGCGECGRTWKSKESLDQDISKICETFTYRKAAYEKDKGTWLPVPYKNLPSNLMDQIEKEPSPFKSKKSSK